MSLRVVLRAKYVVCSALSGGKPLAELAIIGRWRSKNQCDTLSLAKREPRVNFQQSTHEQDNRLGGNHDAVTFVVRRVYVGT